MTRQVLSKRNYTVNTSKCDYSLLVPKIYILYKHILLYLAPTCFGFSPKPNSLKLTAESNPYNAMHVNVQIMLKFRCKNIKIYNIYDT
jgi:hypothetical protein